MESDSPSRWVARHASRIAEGGTVLDVAAGRGRHVRYLRERGYRVVAVDVDVSHLARLGDDPAIEIIEADLEDRPWPMEGRHFEGIVVTNYLHRPLLHRFGESLTPGGILIYETFARGHERYGRPSNPAFILEDRELLDTFSSSLEIIEYEQILQTEPRRALKQRICAVKSRLSGGSA